MISNILSYFSRRKHYCLSLLNVFILTAGLFGITACSDDTNQSAPKNKDNTISENYISTKGCQQLGKGVHQTGGHLNYVNWANYTSPKILRCFQKLTGIQLEINYTSDDNMTKAKLLTGHTGYDIVEQGTLYLPYESPAGAFEKIDTTRLSNYKNRKKVIYEKISQLNDPGNQYAIIYSYGTTGIGYDAKAVRKRLPKGEKPDDWQYLFEPEHLKKFQDCGISFLDEPEQIFGNLLYYLGKDPNSKDPKDYRQAAEYLIKNVRPYLTYFDSNRYEADLASGNLCLVMGYSGDVIRSYEMSKDADVGTEIKYLIPKSGTSIFFDALMIPKGAKHIDEAYQFLNYMLNPRVAAENSNFIYQPNAVNGSLPYMKPIFNDKNINPTEKMIQQMYVIELWKPKLQEYINRLWFSVKFGIALEDE